MTWAGAALLLVTWVAAWWGSRRLRLWFAVLAPVVTLGGVVVSASMAFSEQFECARRQCGGVVHSFLPTEQPTGLDAVLQDGWLLALCVAVPLTAVTLVVEYVLLVRRQNREAAAAQG